MYSDVKRKSCEQGLMHSNTYKSFFLIVTHQLFDFSGYIHHLHGLKISELQLLDSVTKTTQTS